MKPCTCLAALLFAGSLPAAAITIAGPPTFATGSTLQVYRADNRPLVAIAIIDSAYRSAGAGSSTAGIVPIFYDAGPPSVAEAEADDFSLRATARSQGTLFSDLANTPAVAATARAETTRFFNFGADWAVQDIPLLLDGVLGGALGYAEIPGPNFARMSYSLTLTDAGGTVLGSVFEVRAQVQHVGGGQFVTTRSTAGGADPVLWEAAFSPTALPGSTFGTQQAWSVGYIDLVDSAFVARAGQTYGFRWTLETETRLEGQSVAGQFTADFGHTAEIGLGLDDAEIAALGITEVLTTPVPEPATVAFWGLGLALLAWRRRAGIGIAALATSSLALAQNPPPGEAVLSLLQSQAGVNWGVVSTPPGTVVDPWRAEGQGPGLYALAEVGPGTLRARAEVPAGVSEARFASAYTELLMQNTGNGAFTLGAGAVSADLDAGFLRGIGADGQGSATSSFSATLDAFGAGLNGTANAVYFVEEANRAGWPVETFRLAAAPGFSAGGSADPAALAVTLALPGFTLQPGEAIRLRLTMGVFAGVINPLGSPGWSADSDASRSAQWSMRLPAGVEFVSAQPLTWVSVVPEPSSALLWAAGMCVLALAGRTRR